VLSATADFASRPLEKRSVSDLLQMATLTHVERSHELHDTLKVGLAKCALRLTEMPFGFCNAPSINRVTSAYVRDFRDVIEYEQREGRQGLGKVEYKELVKRIFNRHRGTMLDVAKGVFEFYEDLNLIFGEGVNLPEMRKDMQLIKDIEGSLDDFFTDRLTLRLLISHVQHLSSIASMDGALSNDDDMIGVVNLATEPITVLSRAYAATRFMCMRDFNVAPLLLVNGMPHDEYISQDHVQQGDFPYVQNHLFYIFLELTKNAARASIERVLGDDGENSRKHLTSGDVPAMHVTVAEAIVGSPDRTVKFSDHGTGMSREMLLKAFCYFYSSVKHRPTVAQEVSDFDKRVPLAGFGFGLPISRVMARYFSGDIDLNSIQGKGTDVYIYL